MAMMNYNMIGGVGGSGMALFGWLAYLLVIAFLATGTAAFWKYVTKK